LIVSQYWANILDIILPKNESRPLHTQIATEYFIDQQKYISLIMLHMTTAYCIGTAAVIATGTILLAYIQHFCGMFKIARYEVNNYKYLNYNNTILLFYKQIKITFSL